MKAIEFPEHNMVLAKDQPEYLPLPVFRAPDGLVVSCYRLTWRERLKLLFTGRFWLQQLTFNQPLQPQCPTVDYPFAKQDRPFWTCPKCAFTENALDIDGDKLPPTVTCANCHESFTPEQGILR